MEYEIGLKGGGPGKHPRAHISRTASTIPTTAASSQKNLTTNGGHNRQQNQRHRSSPRSCGWWLNLVWPYPSGVNDVLILLEASHVVVR